MLSCVGQEEVLPALNKGGREDGDDFVASLLDDPDGRGVLVGADAEVTLWNEDPKSGILHPFHHVHCEFLEKVRWLLDSIRVLTSK